MNRFIFLILTMLMLAVPATRADAALSYAQTAIETAMAKWAAFPKATIMWWHASPKQGWCQSTGLMSTSFQMAQASDVINSALVGMNQSWLDALSGKTVGLEGEISATSGYLSKNEADLDSRTMQVYAEIEKYNKALGFYSVGYPCLRFTPGIGIITSDAISGRLDSMMSAETRNFSRGLSVDANGKVTKLAPTQISMLLAANAAKSEASGSYFMEYGMFTDEQWEAWNAFRSVAQEPPMLARAKFSSVATENQYKTLEAASAELRTIIDKPMRDFANDRRADIPFEPLRPWLGFSIPTPFAMPMSADENGAISVKRMKPPTEGEIKEYVDKVKQEIEAQNGGPLTDEQSVFVDAAARQYAGTKYSQSGSRDPLAGTTDCSGYVWKIGSDAGVFSGGRAPTAADISKSLNAKKGGSIGKDDLSSDKLTGQTYIIGVAEAKGDNGRWNNVSHTVMAFRDPTTGKMMVTEAQGVSGAGQTITYDYDKWYARQQQMGRNLYGADMTQDFSEALGGGKQAGSGSSSEEVEVDQTSYTQETNLMISKHALLQTIGERYISEDFLTRLDLLSPAGISKERMRLEGFINLLMNDIREELRFRNLLESIDGAKILKAMAAEKELILDGADIR